MNLADSIGSGFAAEMRKLGAAFLAPLLGTAARAVGTTILGNIAGSAMSSAKGQQQQPTQPPAQGQPPPQQPQQP